MKDVKGAIKLAKGEIKRWQKFLIEAEKNLVELKENTKKAF